MSKAASDQHLPHRRMLVAECRQFLVDRVDELAR
jgi:hypothetical protein